MYYHYLYLLLFILFNIKCTLSLCISLHTNFTQTLDTLMTLVTTGILPISLLHYYLYSSSSSSSSSSSTTGGDGGGGPIGIA